MFFYKSYRTYYPESSPKFYRAVILFLPSILFWATSIGKDSLVFFALGLATYSFVAYWKQKKFWFVLLFIVSVLLINVVRPHIAVIFLILAFACTICYFCQKDRKGLVRLVYGFFLLALVFILFIVPNNFIYFRIAPAGKAYSRASAGFYYKNRGPSYKGIPIPLTRSQMRIGKISPGRKEVLSGSYALRKRRFKNYLVSKNKNILVLHKEYSIIPWNKYNFGKNKLRKPRELSLRSFEEIYYLQKKKSMQGGSRYNIPGLTYLNAIWVLPSMFLRPFLWESHNVLAALSSLETVFWLFIFIVRRRFLFSRLKSVGNDPLVLFSVLYCLAGCFLLTGMSNIGIIARQRVMLLPFLFILFS